MPRGIHPRKSKIDWNDKEAANAYIAEYRRKRRADGVEVPKHRQYVRVPQVEEKRDIFEVAAMLYRAMIDVLHVAALQDDNANKALAAYREFWEED